MSFFNKNIRIATQNGKARKPFDFRASPPPSLRVAPLRESKLVHSRHVIPPPAALELPKIGGIARGSLSNDRAKVRESEITLIFTWFYKIGAAPQPRPATPASGQFDRTASANLTEAWAQKRPRSFRRGRFDNRFSIGTRSVQARRPRRRIA
jgi:hypothetical protein